jgi:hypothetical protein
VIDLPAWGAVIAQLDRFDQATAAAILDVFIDAIGALQ